MEVEKVSEKISNADQGRIYFERDNVEIIFQSDMECWIFLDFKSMKFETGSLDDLLEHLSAEALADYLTE